ncbi:DUF1615 domain-containing protein [Dokdonella ginsengisoli]|uniref:DUF1615 domain-containing protein n=1 Tax=Dokdonella ginsengisoli TaxID=363846 RepID=A0ABV9QST4_9GAMM
MPTIAFPEGSMPRAALGIALALLAGCATQPPAAPARRPADVRAEIVRLMPASAKDRNGWATDITAAFAAIGLEPNTQNLCATLAVIEQESTFTVDPAVPGLGRIARAEIDRRAEQHHVPQLLVRGALALKSSNGKSYAERIAAVRTERELSLVYEDLIDRIPLGQRLFAGSNPVRTGGPMQVSVAFAERHAREHPYPYATQDSIRHELFSRRGGVYFGIAHLLGYPANYERMIYRFADFNAGFYASRNAAFQNAVSLASGIPLALDGDLVNYDDDKPGATELAVRTLSRQIDMGDSRIRRALERGDGAEFERSDLYERVFALAERTERKPLPRALMPRIDLKSPKITRKLTTEWFATRVDGRYRACLAKAPAAKGAS